MTFDHHTQLIRSWGLVRPHVFKHQAPTLDQPKPKPNPQFESHSRWALVLGLSIFWKHIF